MMDSKGPRKKKLYNLGLDCQLARCLATLGSTFGSENIRLVKRPMQTYRNMNK